MLVQVRGLETAGILWSDTLNTGISVLGWKETYSLDSLGSAQPERSQTGECAYGCALLCIKRCGADRRRTRIVVGKAVEVLVGEEVEVPGWRRCERRQPVDVAGFGRSSCGRPGVDEVEGN